jgi:hypothetical protein
MTRVAATPARVALCAAGAVALLVGLRLAAASGDFTRFAVAGSDFTDPAHTPVPVAVIPGAGYDGQFQLRLAFDPWPETATADGIALVPPAYRHQRILQPWLAFVLSGGSARLAPAALVLVNGLAVVALAGALASLARRRGLAPAWALVPALYFGFAQATGRDLSEPVAAACVSFAVIASLDGRRGLAALSLALALLARETSVVTAAAFAGVLLLSRADSRAAAGAVSRADSRAAAGAVSRADSRAAAGARTDSRVGAWLAATLPLVVFAGWQALLWMHWGALPIASGGGLGLPGVGLVQGLLATLRTAGTLEALVWSAEIAWLAGLLASLGRPLWKALPAISPRAPAASDAPFEANPETPETPETLETVRWLAFAWLGQTGLLACAPAYVWADDWSFARVSGEWVVLGCALGLLQRSPPGRLLAATGFLLWLVTVARLALRP